LTVQLKNYSVRNDIRTIRVLNKTATTFGNIGIIAGSAIVIFMVVAVVAIGSLEAKSLKIL
jgi:hypothetical protein